MCWNGPSSLSYVSAYRNVTPPTTVVNDNQHDIAQHKLSTSSLSQFPRATDVVCARGRQFFNHPGNKRYRVLINSAIKRYASACNKMEKTLVVLDIIEKVHKSNGRFIKREKKGGPWVEADEIFAREKCTQSLRDGLSTKYRSATKAKRERRWQHDKQFHGDLDMIVRSNAFVVQQMETFAQRVSLLNTNRPPVSDELVLEFFTQANVKLLETMKNDPSMHQQFQEAARSADTGADYVRDDMDLSQSMGDDEDMYLWEEILNHSSNTQKQPEQNQTVPTVIEMY
ncbi:hypothetical protein IV203_025687 [Nitzschia inconspicua]|uniref:DUF6824 domain-containing protein n=1 Tax=Nitzschia inconspicua TaxID=303405 RepID=A0A9K3PWJ2_9STRA|nr:hypothetical protein IV203_025687 [Nitzschia inconspicua]